MATFLVVLVPDIAGFHLGSVPVPAAVSFVLVSVTTGVRVIIPSDSPSELTSGMDSKVDKAGDRETRDFRRGFLVVLLFVSKGRLLQGRRFRCTTWDDLSPDSGSTP